MPCSIFRTVSDIPQIAAIQTHLTTAAPTALRILAAALVVAATQVHSLGMAAVTVAFLMASVIQMDAVVAGVVEIRIKQKAPQS